MLNAKGLLHSEIQCTSEQLPGDVFRAGCTQKQLPEMPGRCGCESSLGAALNQQQPKAPAWLNTSPRIFSAQLHRRRC